MVAADGVLSNARRPATAASSAATATWRFMPPASPTPRRSMRARARRHQPPGASITTAARCRRLSSVQARTAPAHSSNRSGSIEAGAGDSGATLARAGGQPGQHLRPHRQCGHGAAACIGGTSSTGRHAGRAGPRDAQRGQPGQHPVRSSGIRPGSDPGPTLAAWTTPAARCMPPATSAGAARPSLTNASGSLGAGGNLALHLAQCRQQRRRPGGER